jgi:hypothetical protein
MGASTCMQSLILLGLEWNLGLWHFRIALNYASTAPYTLQLEIVLCSARDCAVLYTQLPIRYSSRLCSCAVIRNVPMQLRHRSNSRVYLVCVLFALLCSLWQRLRQQFNY